jgi:hypothetical protein
MLIKNLHRINQHNIEYRLISSKKKNPIINKINKKFYKDLMIFISFFWFNFILNHNNNNNN